MAKLNLVPVNGTLVPFDEEAKRYISKLKEGKDFCQCDIVKKRNPRFHKKYFAMLRTVSEQVDCAQNDLHDFIKDKLGRYDIVSLRGMVKKNYHSISFASMDELEFQDYYHGSIHVLAEMLALDYESLLGELEAEYN